MASSCDLPAERIAETVRRSPYVISVDCVLKPPGTLFDHTRRWIYSISYLVRWVTQTVVFRFSSCYLTPYSTTTDYRDMLHHVQLYTKPVMKVGGTSLGLLSVVPCGSPVLVWLNMACLVRDRVPSTLQLHESNRQSCANRR